MVPGGAGGRPRLAASANDSGSARAAATDGDERPTDWRGEFGGRTWTRTTNPDGTPGEWYLHLFTPEQPDLNWDHPDVRREHEDILRFWFDRGAAGVRIDSAALLVKDPALPEVTGDQAPGRTTRPGPRRAARHLPQLAGDRRLATRAPGSSWARCGSPDIERFARYLRPDELHTAFNFDFMARPWDAGAAARLDRRDARGARADRRAGHLGAVATTT